MTKHYVLCKHWLEINWKNVKMKFFAMKIEIHLYNLFFRTTNEPKNISFQAWIVMRMIFRVNDERILYENHSLLPICVF